MIVPRRHEVHWLKANPKRSEKLQNLIDSYLSKLSSFQNRGRKPHPSRQNFSLGKLGGSCLNQLWMFEVYNLLNRLQLSSDQQSISVQRLCCKVGMAASF